MIFNGDRVVIYKAYRYLWAYTKSETPMVEGIFINPPELKKQFVLAMTKRKNIELTGIWNTSPVVGIENAPDGGIYIFTQNSLYKIEKISKEI
jgi:hypothetical protein